MKPGAWNLKAWDSYRLGLDLKGLGGLMLWDGLGPGAWTACLGPWGRGLKPKYGTWGLAPGAWDVVVWNLESLRIGLGLVWAWGIRPKAWGLSFSNWLMLPVSAFKLD